MMLSVVIATRDRATLLAGALDALAAQRSAPPFEIVVADNGSTDDTPAVVEARRSAFGSRLRRIAVVPPNRGAARNRGVAAAEGDIIVFIDDDVITPDGFLAAHAAHHARRSDVTVTGPIVNVPSPHARPRPSLAHHSRAFFCTANASVSRRAFESAGGFDERFDLYGWEDTDLGIRLRRCGAHRVFAWAAYLYHIKPPGGETLDAALRRTTEKARMAARLVHKDPSPRTRMATGAYGANILRGLAVSPSWALRWYEGMARNERIPKPVRAFARARTLDGAYVRTLRDALRHAA